MQSKIFRFMRAFLPTLLLVGSPMQAAFSQTFKLLCEPQGTARDRPDDVPFRLHALDQPPDQIDDGLPVSTLQAEGFLVEPIDEMIGDIREGTYTKVDSILIARNGKLVFESYFNGFDRSMKHQTRSLFKSVTSTLAGIALDQELIPDLDVPISKYFPDYWPEIAGDRQLKDKITLSHMLSMTPGFDAEENFGVGPWRETDMWWSDDWVRFALDLPMAHTPGEEYRYSSPTTFLIGVLVERAVSMPLPEFAENNLFGPLGITNYCWRFSKKGRAIGMGSFHMRPRDMMKIGQLFLDKGTWKGQQIVSEAWVNQATQPLVAAVPPNTKTDGSQAMGYSMGYGFQWFTYTPRSFEDPRVAYYFASGNGGQRIYVFPKLDMVVVFTGGHYNRGKAHKQTIEILNRSILYSAL